MRVSVFDPHPVIHKALTSLLPEHGFVVVSLAFDGRNAMRVIREASAQIVITEVRLAGTDGLALLEELTTPNVSGPNINPLKPIVYSADSNPSLVARAVANGALDYQLKSDPVDQLVASLVHVINGPADISATSGAPSTLFCKIRGDMRSTETMDHFGIQLTSREWQVLRHLGFGLSNREIARSLTISVETVKEHVQNILRKLNCKDRTEAAVWAVKKAVV